MVVRGVFAALHDLRTTGRIGIEARVLIDGEIHRTQAFRGRKDSKEMIDVTWDWRKAFEKEGWGE